jgi:hypothetical protein
MSSSSSSSTSVSPPLIDTFARKASVARLTVGEAACALIAAGAVAPAVAIVDQAIFSSASGREPMLRCIQREAVRFATQPLRFVRGPAFLWIYGVYGATYVAANVGESLFYRYVASDDGHASAATEAAAFKFAVTSGTNISMSILKDRAFAGLFGAVGHAAHAVPAASLALFGMRDCITVGASFTLVPTVAKSMQANLGLSAKSSDVAAQLLTPCAAQLFNTPLYLAGLSLYNSPEHTTQQRLAFMRGHYVKTLLARWGRIFPAFGIGGVLNKSLRKQLHSSV